LWLALISILDMFANLNEIRHTKVKRMIWHAVQLISTRADWERKRERERERERERSKTRFTYLRSFLLQNAKWDKGNESSLSRRFLNRWWCNCSLRFANFIFWVFSVFSKKNNRWLCYALYLCATNIYFKLKKNYL